MASLDLKNASVLRVILCVVLGGAVLSLYFFTHFVPINFPNQQERISGLKSDLQKKSSELARARQSVADLPRFEAEYEQLHTRWHLAQELLPPDAQMTALMRKITLAGQQTGVGFLMFRPGAIRQEQHYHALPIEITVVGDYHQVGSFLAELANLRRIVTVDGLRLDSNVKPDVPYTTQATLTASAYSLNTSGPAAPTTAPTTAPAGAKGSANERKQS
jgi:type IV pilus assembly protein PilO